MFTVREMIFVKMVEDARAVRVELDVDSVDDLPDADAVSGYLLWQGSIAHDISTGDFYCIDSEGTWYAQDGSGAVEPENQENLLNAELGMRNSELMCVPDNIVGEIEENNSESESGVDG